MDISVMRHLSAKLMHPYAEPSMEQLQRHIANLQADLDALRWQSIDTLPLDEHPVWLRDSTGRIFIGGREYVDDEGWLWWRAYGTVDWGISAGWYVSDGETADIDPTQWMPLPDTEPRPQRASTCTDSEQSSAASAASA